MISWKVPSFSEATEKLGGHANQPFTEDLREPLSLLVGMGKASGAQYVEFFFERTQSLRILVEERRVTNISPVVSCGVGIRVLHDEQDGFVCSTDLSYDGLVKGLDSALSMVGLSLPSSHARVSPVNLEPLRDYARLGNKGALLDQCPSLGDSTVLLREINSVASEKVPHTKMSRTALNRHWQEVLVVSSEGTFARDIRLNDNVRQSLVCEKGTERVELAEREGRSLSPRLLTEVKADDMAERLKERSQNLLSAEFVKGGDYPVILGNGFGGVLFHEAIGHTIETTNVFNSQTAPLAGKLGQKVAHESVTAWDEGVTPCASGSLDMDDEGFPIQKTLLIENGILRNYLSDKKSEMRYGVPRTGSSRRQNFTYAASSRMRNTFIAPGNQTEQDIISSLDHGLYCSQLGGGSVDVTSGNFNFAALDVWEVKNGKLTKPLKGATLIGNSLEIMANISQCANNIELTTGVCGSISGSIYTTVGQPTILVDKITVGGH